MAGDGCVRSGAYLQVDRQRFVQSDLATAG
jgi:hypothetical protein